MSCYFIANILIHDEKEYQNYLSKAGEVFSKYNGEYLTVDDSPVVLEGSWDYTRIVIVRFENRNDFDAWYYSEEYQEILKHRLGAANCDSIVVEE